jgi:hypothetical protein
MKSYMDFIADISSNVNLLAELEVLLPFPDQQSLTHWFMGKGYQLADGDVEMLYGSQSSLMENSEQISY